MIDGMAVLARVRAYAKVNLSLDVGPVRPDGYHPYVSWVTSVGLHDTLTFERADGLSVTTSTGLQDTLVRRALAILGEVCGQRPAFAVRIDKRIPVGSGLGGGSADAAAALVVGAQLLGVHVDLMDLAAKLGTDVPFCLTGGTARLHGRGELVDPAAPLPPIGMLVCVPPVQVPTAAVFAAFDEAGSEPSGPANPSLFDELPDELRSKLAECSFSNDLERAAFTVEPALARWKRLIEDTVGRSVLMTGSGAGFVCYGDSVDDFTPSAVDSLRKGGLQVWLTTPVDSGVEWV